MDGAAAGLEELAGLINFRVGAWQDFGYAEPPTPECATIPPLGERSAKAIEAGHEAVKDIDQLIARLHQVRAQLVERASPGRGHTRRPCGRDAGRAPGRCPVNGPEHWREADLILTSDPCEYGCPHGGCQHEMRMIARAQVHATLALAAAVVDGPAVMRPEDRDEWDRATSRLEPEESEAAGDTQRLDRIRVLLAKFDWEHDDRQLALEAIERIVDGGQA